MKLKVRDIDISSGGPLIAVINYKDAAMLDLHVMDRVKIKRGRKIETVVVDIARSDKVIQNGRIGIFEEVIDSLKLKNNDEVEISIARKPLSLTYIKKKLDGQKLTKNEIDQIVWDIVHNKLSAVELTYFVAACYTNVMTTEETILLTKAMVEHGDSLKLSKYPIIDKHSIGGIPGNRTTMIVVPIIAAAGYFIPKTSSRSITSPAGTADTMEVLANVTFPIKKMKEILLKTNGCIVWGGALNLAPADDKIIAVERPLEIDAESQLLASIMAKKHSVSSTHVLIDVPIGKDAKVKSKAEGLRLKRKFEKIGKRLKKHVKVLLTDGTQPIGNGIGPALEARDVLWVLKRDLRKPFDLEKKCLMICSNMFRMAGIKDGYRKSSKILESGKAYQKMVEIIKAQGGKEIAAEDIAIGRYSHDILSAKSGKVADIDNLLVSRVARIAGAPADKGSGIYLYKHIGDKVKKGEKLYTIYSDSEHEFEYAKDVAKNSKVFVVR
ncbi:AMP phosphorylase, partial [Candidatus Woesearchaeota archaeon]|nr:AMP phosphorylase [Candidatus Woesearchaeota archaeon]